MRRKTASLWSAFPAGRTAVGLDGGLRNKPYVYVYNLMARGYAGRTDALHEFRKLLSLVAEPHGRAARVMGINDV
jgi:hypothetical protein